VPLSALRSVAAWIHEGLSVIETWNSVTSFIFYGKGVDFATNQREEQEVAMLCLHLLQISMGYVNTLMIQQVLAEPAWTNHLGPTDVRALTLLVHTHINLYGRFKLDLTTQLALDVAAVRYDHNECIKMNVRGRAAAHTTCYFMTGRKNIGFGLISD
jgi:hypothetical protein